MTNKKRSQERCKFRMTATSDWKLSHVACRLYYLLDDYSGLRGIAWPHIDTLTGVLAVSGRHLKRALSELRERGYIKSVRGQSGNRYSFAWAGFPEMEDDRRTAASILKELRGTVSPAQSEELKKLPYGEFLKTDFWKLVTLYITKTRGEKCELCLGTKDIQCHHKTYEHHGYEHLHLTDLILLCDDCHSKFHDKLPSHGRAA